MIEEHHFHVISYLQINLGNAYDIIVQRKGPINFAEEEKSCFQTFVLMAKPLI